MTPADLAAWQARLGLNQIEAAARLSVPPQTYRNWLHERRAIPDPISLLCQYVERFGSLPRS